MEDLENHSKGPRKDYETEDPIVNLDTTKIIKTDTEAKCAVRGHPLKDPVSLSCGHQACKECFGMYSHQQMHQTSCVKCPQCSKVLDKKEYREFLGDEMKKKLDELDKTEELDDVQKDPMMQHCPTCKKAVYTGKVDPSSPVDVLCESNHSFCSVCNYPPHDGPCRSAFTCCKMTHNPKALCCPKCKSVVQLCGKAEIKNQGRIECTVCKGREDPNSSFDFHEYIFITKYGYWMLYLFLPFMLPILFIFCLANKGLDNMMKAKPSKGGRRNNPNIEGGGIIFVILGVALGLVIYAFLVLCCLFLLPCAYVYLIQFHIKQRRVEKKLRSQGIMQ